MLSELSPAAPCSLVRFVGNAGGVAEELNFLCRRWIINSLLLDSVVLPSFNTCNETEKAWWRNGSVTKALFPFSQCPWKPWSVFIFLCGYQWSAASRGKGSGHWPPEEQAGELATFCKQAISVAQGTLLPCTAKNVGSFLCSVRSREERVLSHTPCQFMLLSSFPESSQCLLQYWWWWWWDILLCPPLYARVFFKTAAGYFRESDMKQEKLPGILIWK